MSLSADSGRQLEDAINAFASRNFIDADDGFSAISAAHPDNWTARYFHAMTLCAMGDFSDAREQLLHILTQADELIWQQVAQNGLALLGKKEQSLLKSLEGLL